MQTEEGDGAAGPDDVLLLLTGTPDRLSREDYREQLDLWIQSRGLGEFSATITPTLTQNQTPTLTRRVFGTHHRRHRLLLRTPRAAAAAFAVGTAARAAEECAAGSRPALDPQHLPTA